MRIGSSARALVRLGVVLLVIGVAAGVWEILASQAPGSTWHVGLLSGPVGTLRGTTLWLGVALLSSAWLMPWAAPTREPRGLVIAVHVGVVMLVIALVWGATTGMYGLQIEDVRDESIW